MTARRGHILECYETRLLGINSLSVIVLYLLPLWCRGQPQTILPVAPGRAQAIAVSQTAGTPVATTSPCQPAVSEQLACPLADDS